MNIPQTTDNAQVDFVLFFETREDLLVTVRGNSTISFWDIRNTLTHLYSRPLQMEKVLLPFHSVQPLKHL